MTDDRSLERAARSWLENGPTQAPDRAVEAALLHIQTTPQERDLRIPWRLPGKVATVRLGTAVLVGVLAVGGAIFVFGGAPPPVIGPPSIGPTPATQPTPSNPPTTSTRPTPTATTSPLEASGVIVFEHKTPGLNVRLETLQPNGLGLELLPDDKGNQEHPAWSSDGSRLAFAAWDPRDNSSRQQIWETDALGATPRLITTACAPPACLEEFGPNYSADGRQMAFIRVAGQPGEAPTSFVVAVRDLATGEVTELDTTRTSLAEGFLEHPRFSPDGRRLVYSRILVDAEESPIDSIIQVVNSDGSGLAALTEPGFEAGDAEWSPDGSRILFARELVHHWFGGGKGSAENAFIYTMAPDGSDRTQLTFEMSGAPSWTAGGNQILFNLIPVASIGTPDFYVMNADGSDPRPVAIYGDCCRWYPAQQPTP